MSLGPFEVRFADPAVADLNRLFDFLLDKAQTVEDLRKLGSGLNTVRLDEFSKLLSR